MSEKLILPELDRIADTVFAYRPKDKMQKKKGGMLRIVMKSKKPKRDDKDGRHWDADLTAD
jgi:hypothetical protein